MRGLKIEKPINKYGSNVRIYDKHEKWELFEPECELNIVQTGWYDFGPNPSGKE